MKKVHDEEEGVAGDSNNKKVKFTEKEIKFLLENEACRIATSYDDDPHIAPVSYIFENGYIFFATDYNSKKYRNLERNKRLAIVVDIYNSSVDNKAVIINGSAEFIERGKEFDRLYSIFESKFEWVRRDPWKEGEAPFVKVKPVNKVSWGIE